MQSRIPPARSPRLLPIAGAMLLVAATLATPALAQESDCVKCHGTLVEKKVVHAALQAGCAFCHANLDASAVPHKNTGKVPRGLSSEPPELCNGCHPKEMFEGKVTHVPAAAGLCMICHDPHASDQIALARKPPVALCLDCHADLQNRPHVLAGFSRRGHPTGDDPRSAGRQDPLRPGKPFYCGSCHETHRSDHARLTRFDTRPPNNFCQGCHKM